MPDDLQLTQHFHISEFRCRHCGEVNGMAARRLASRLQLAREFAGPIIIVSGFRCQAENFAEGGKPNSQHLLGLAADILVTSDGHRFQLVKALLESGFKRIGIGKSIIHADIGDIPGFAVWTYYA